MSELIPPPKVVREQLARHEREGRLLRRLYKLSMAAAEEIREVPRKEPHSRRQVAV